MTEATPMNGVKMTEVTVTAASPDVVGRLMQQITDAVLAAIPAGSIEKIAAEVIEQGQVVRQVRSHSYSRDVETVTYSLSDDAKAKVTEKLKIEIEKQVNAYLGEQAIKQLVSECVAKGVAEGIAQLPFHAAQVTCQRMGGVLMGDIQSFQAVTDVHLNAVQDAVAKTQIHLRDKGVITGYDVPMLNPAY